jgi:hypothetical protein
MITIIEGVDRVGKSSLARSLANIMPDHALVHCVVPPAGEHVFDYHRRMLSTSSNLIVDRLHWSEYAYGSTYRSGCAYSARQWKELEDILVSRGARVILMSDALVSIKKRWTDAEEFDVAGLVRLNGFFFDLFYDRADLVSRLPKISLNWRDIFNPDGSSRPGALDSVKAYADGGDAS